MRYVPTDEFAPVLRRLIASDDAELNVIEERAGIGSETISSILRERRPGCDFNQADKILCALGAQHLWWGELSHIYYAIELEQECDRPGCDVRFEPSGHQIQRYCSEDCRRSQEDIRRAAAKAELRAMRESYKEARAA